MPVLQDEDELGCVVELVRQRRDDIRDDRGRSASEPVERAMPTPGWTLSRPRMTWPQSRTGSASPASSDTHTNRVRCSSSAAHCARSVVFPYPAGALRSVSRRPRPCRNDSSKCRRWTSVSLSTGMRSLATTIRGVANAVMVPFGRRPTHRSRRRALSTPCTPLDRERPPPANRARPALSHAQARNYCRAAIRDPRSQRSPG